MAFGLESPKGVPTPSDAVVTSMTVEMFRSGASPLADSRYTVDPDATSAANDYVLIGSAFDKLEVDIHPIAGPGRLEVHGTIDLLG